MVEGRDGKKEEALLREHDEAERTQRVMKMNEYVVYKITIDEEIRYRICVPKSQLKEFEEWRGSKKVEYVGQTGDECTCLTVFNHGYEFAPWCDDLPEEE